MSFFSVRCTRFFSAEVYVYPRVSEGIVETQFTNHPKISRVEAPIIELSSTLIRNSIKANKNIKPLVSESVWKYIDDMGFYRYVK